jgi:sugar fermentation stimulation protein A
MTIMAAVGCDMGLVLHLIVATCGLRGGAVNAKLNRWGGLMEVVFEPDLVPGRLIRRYKRFLSDIQLDDGREVTAHCANPGAMLGLKDKGLKVWVQPATNPARKLQWSWRLVEFEDGHFAGIDTSVPNQVVGAALRAGRISELAAYGDVRAEVKYGASSRVDFLLTGDGLPKTYVEVKNVHLRRQGDLAEFPDSVTARGAKHLDELSDMVAQGHRAVMFYLVQRTDCAALSLAADIDPTYAARFAGARAAGVDVLVYDTDINRHGVALRRALPFKG